MTECEPKPFSTDFGSVGGGEGLCGRHGAGLDWPEEKDNFSNNIYPTYFCCNKDLSGAMLPIYYGTSFLTFCQISGLKEAFEKIIKYQTALKFEF